MEPTTLLLYMAYCLAGLGALGFVVCVGLIIGCYRVVLSLVSDVEGRLKGMIQQAEVRIEEEIKRTLRKAAEAAAKQGISVPPVSPVSTDPFEPLRQHVRELREAGVVGPGKTAAAEERAATDPSVPVLKPDDLSGPPTTPMQRAAVAVMDAAAKQPIPQPYGSMAHEYMQPLPLDALVKPEELPPSSAIREKALELVEEAAERLPLPRLRKLDLGGKTVGEVLAESGVNLVPLNAAAAASGIPEKIQEIRDRQEAERQKADESK